MRAPATYNKAAIRRFCEAMNTRDPKEISGTIDGLFEADADIRTPVPLRSTGAEAQREVFLTLLRGFPDLHLSLEDLIAEDDKVVARITVTGTHRGDYMGLSATLNPVIYNEIFIFRFTGGRIAETWGVVDVFTQMKQLGAIAE